MYNIVLLMVSNGHIQSGSRSGYGWNLLVYRGWARYLDKEQADRSIVVLMQMSMKTDK